jgi:hypothetical protein
MKKALANIICESTLWNVGKEGHNALSELVTSLEYYILDYIENREWNNMVESDRFS